MPRTPQPVTLKTIARMARVTPSVVSTVLTGHRGSIRYSEETAERVRAVAARLHYRPNRLAQSLRARDHRAIGLLSTGLFVLPTFYLHWLSLALGERNQLLIIQNLRHADDADGCQMLQQRFVDAAVCAEVPGTQVLRRIAETGLPVLFINADPPVPGPRLLFDEPAMMRQAVGHLRERGYRRIILCHREDDGYWGRERRTACLAAAREHGLPAPRIVDAPLHQFAATADALTAACQAGSGVIVQYGQILPFLQHRLAGAGLSIPGDVGVFAIGKPAPSDMAWSHAEVDTRILATTTAEMLADPAALAPEVCRRAAYVITTAASTARP